MKRLSALIHDGGVWERARNVIEDITDLQIIEQLLSYNDQSLSAPDNLKAIIDERFAEIHAIEDKQAVAEASDKVSVRQTLF